MMNRSTSIPGRPVLAGTERRKTFRLLLLRILIALNVILGGYYLGWRYFNSINWAAWPLALALIAAETYSVLEGWLFGLTMWRLRERGEAPPPPPDATVDVFITCYNESADLVRETAVAARDIRWPHNTYVLDDGASPEMRAMTEAEGIGYIVRSAEWKGKDRHAKAGNVNNALFQTQGEFILILDADQIPSPDILHRTLGYFSDPKVALVQTPQWFYNVPTDDPLGVQAELFYGPIQQGKDGWNAAFFCGSNAVLRREALMFVGVSFYVKELEFRVRRALQTADRLLRSAARQLKADDSPGAREALHELQSAVRDAQSSIRRRTPIQEVTWEFQRRAEAVSRVLVSDDLQRIKAELAEIPGLDASHIEGSMRDVLDDEEALGTLARREASPLAAIGVVRSLLLTVDVDREDEAQPIMPLARISVTEDMATSMRLHARGWRSVYHHEVLARGLAPEDLRTSLQQRLRWAQGTIQVLLRENPLFVRGLTLGQRLMYFATMWSYLSGFFAVVYLTAPVLYFFFGLLPLRAYSDDFFARLMPYLLVNQLMFIGAGWGIATWRGQQYSLALFPLWIKAVTSAIGNVYFGRKLGFVVTPKTRQGGVHWRLVWPQLTMMALLTAGVVWGLARLMLGRMDQVVPTLVNVFWAGYDLLVLSVIFKALSYRPPETAELSLPTEPGATTAEHHGRMGAGRA